MSDNEEAKENQDSDSDYDLREIDANDEGNNMSMIQAKYNSDYFFK